MCANLKQVLSWEIKKIDLLKSWIYNVWFCVLQEELAFMYEMLGLFEDALIQYDELDALFTQYILFFAAGSMYYICITFVLHITHQVLHTVNKLLFCARNFCEVGKSLIVVNISHHKQVFDKYMYLFVARNIHYFFPKIVS